MSSDFNQTIRDKAKRPRAFPLERPRTPAELAADAIAAAEAAREELDLIEDPIDRAKRASELQAADAPAQQTAEREDPDAPAFNDVIRGRVRREQETHRVDD